MNPNYLGYGKYICFSAANFGPPIIHPNLCFLCCLLFKFSSFPFVDSALVQGDNL